MKTTKILLGIALAVILVLLQAAVALAAPTTEETILSGKVTVVTMETDRNTGLNHFVVSVEDEFGETHTIRITEETAYELGLLYYDDDGNPFIVEILPVYIEIQPTMVIPEEEYRHPVVIALVTFFSDDIVGLDYETIMEAHSDGNGFGVIAQALWMIKKLGGNSNDFVLLLEAKKTGDYQAFALEDGTIPSSWGELRRAISGNLGNAMSQKVKEIQDKIGTVTTSNGNHHKEKNKDNSGHGNGNGNGGGNGIGHGNRP
jgi:hypothetical protein